MSNKRQKYLNDVTSARRRRYVRHQTAAALILAALRELGASTTRAVAEHIGEEFHRVKRRLSILREAGQCTSEKVYDRKVRAERVLWTFVSDTPLIEVPKKIYAPRARSDYRLDHDPEHREWMEFWQERHRLRKSGKQGFSATK